MPVTDVGERADVGAGRLETGNWNLETFLVLGALWLLVFSVTTQNMMLAPILPRISEQLSIAEFRLGSLVTGYAAAVAVVALFMGPVSDRLGRRRMLLAGGVLMSVGLALHALANGYAALMTVRILTGAGGGVLTGATGAYIGDYFPYERRGWANGWIMSGMAAGQILGIPLGTVLASASGFRAPFLGLALTMGLASLLIWRFVPQPDVRRLEGSLGIRRSLEHYATMLSQPRVGAAALAYLAMFMGASLYVLFLPTWLETVRGASPGEIASLFAVGGVATVIAGPQAGKLSDRIGRKRIIVGSSIGLGVAMLLTTAAIVGPWSGYAVFFITTALFSSRAGPFQALMTEIVPVEQRGTAMSLTMAVGQAGAAIGAALAGAAYGAYGYASNTLLATLSAVVVAVLVWRFLPEPELS